MSGTKTLITAALKLAVSNGERRVAQELQSVLIKNYKGSEVKLEVRQIMSGTAEVAATPATNTSGKKMTASTLSLSDFEKKTNTPTLKTAVAKEGVKTFNPHKALIEMTDEEIKAKMGNSAESATLFINQIREVVGVDPLKEPEDFTEDFLKEFRSTLNDRIKMTEEEVAAAESSIKEKRKQEILATGAEGSDEEEEEEKEEEEKPKRVTKKAPATRKK